MADLGLQPRRRSTSLTLTTISTRPETYALNLSFRYFAEGDAQRPRPFFHVGYWAIGPKSSPEPDAELTYKPPEQPEFTGDRNVWLQLGLYMKQHGQKYDRELVKYTREALAKCFSMKPKRKRKGSRSRKR
jgi:hypothetical protein